MRRLFALLLLLPVLASCEAKTEDDDRLSDYLASLDSFTAEAAVTVDFPDRTSSFRLRCDVSGDSCGVEVLEPASIAGIAIAIAPDGVTASYDGASFEVGALDGVQPVTVVAELKRLWSGAVPKERGSERVGETDCAMLIYASGDAETRVWFDAASCEPVVAEVYEGGARIIRCEFVSFVIGGS